MRLFILLSMHLLSINYLAAQSIQRFVLGSAGKVQSAGNYILSTTMGEQASQKIIAINGTILRQGFQQPFLSINTVLPVTWKSFQAYKISDQEASLQWSLSSERNCKGFQIEKMQEGTKEFTRIGFVSSKAEQGNTDTETNYIYRDAHFNNTYTLYRIRQEDGDGKFTYSETRLVTGSGSSSISMDIWPIPANTTVYIQLHGLPITSRLHILDMQGKTIRTLWLPSQQKVSVEGLASGMYIVQLAENPSVRQKIIVQ